MKLLSALCLALLLTACSDGKNESTFGTPGTPAPPTTPTAPNPVTLDQFFSRVLALIGVANETDDPVTLDDVLLTAPDDTDPVPLT